MAKINKQQLFFCFSLGLFCLFLLFLNLDKRIYRRIRGVLLIFLLLYIFHLRSSLGSSRKITKKKKSECFSSIHGLVNIFLIKTVSFGSVNQGFVCFFFYHNHIIRKYVN